MHPVNRTRPNVCRPSIAPIATKHVTFYHIAKSVIMKALHVFTSLFIAHESYGNGEQHAQRDGKRDK